MTEKTARATSFTNQIKYAERGNNSSIVGLAERVFRLYPVRRIGSPTDKLERLEARVVDELEAAALNPRFTAEQLVIIEDSAGQRARVVSVLAEALQQVSSDELRNFELAAKMLTTYDSQSDLSHFFRRCSILAAMVAREIALEISSVSTDRAFLSGLFSEVGALTCLKIDAYCFQSIWKSSGGLPIRRAELETARYGGTTHELGSVLLTRNGLPSDVAEAIGTRVNEATRTRSVLARITAFSRTVAAEFSRCSLLKHKQNLIGTLPKFGSYFGLDVCIALVANPSISPFLGRVSE